MSARNFTQAIGAGATIDLPAGRFFFLKTAAGVVDIECVGNVSSTVRFLGVSAGSKFGPVEKSAAWANMRVTSATAQNLEVIISDDGLFDVANAVTVSGVASVSQAPNTGLTTSAADVSVGNGTASSIVANLSRKSITIGALSTNSGSLRVQSVAAGANKGGELQPGMSITLTNTVAIDVRNDSGVAQSYWVMEET